MKKVLSLLAVLACMAMLGSAAFADVSLTKSAVANFSGSGEVSLSFDLKNISGDTAATQIEWNIPDITLNSDSIQWVTAKVYATVSSTITTSGGAVYMYQDNTNASNTVYKATAPRTNDADPAKTVYSGLVNKTLQGGEYRGYVPMVFTSTTTKATPAYGTDPEAVAGTRFFIDKGDYNWDTQAAYVTIANTGGLTGGADYNIGSNTGYIYFGGNFQNILGGDEFGTEKIIIKSSLE